MRSASLYDLDNQALDQPYENLLNTVHKIYEIVKTNVQVRLMDGQFFVNRKQVKVDFSTYQNTRSLIKIFKHLDVNELLIQPEIERAHFKDMLHAFVDVVQHQKGKINQYEVESSHAVSSKFQNSVSYLQLMSVLARKLAANLGSMTASLFLSLSRSLFRASICLLIHLANLLPSTVKSTFTTHDLGNSSLSSSAGKYRFTSG